MIEKLNKEIPKHLNTPDEMAGRVVEMMIEKHGFSMYKAEGTFVLDLRRLIHDVICLAIDRDRQERLDYENTERDRNQKENGFLNM